MIPRVSLTMSPTTSLLSTSMTRVSQLFKVFRLKFIMLTYLYMNQLQRTLSPIIKFTVMCREALGWSYMVDFSKARMKSSNLDLS